MSRRPPTVYSTHSWWSDANSVGATFSLHAVAKPLLAYLHHREARKLLATLGDVATPSALDMKVLSSYLAFKYTSTATKTMILEEYIRDQWEWDWASPTLGGSTDLCAISGT
ncbi:hypothetical protein C8F01DRAFT_1369386 [Mycena amicta]|nr:hypothetical protein C8F01DRAFT_1369386 [Mycena amicta]